MASSRSTKSMVSAHLIFLHEEERPARYGHVVAFASRPAKTWPPGCPLPGPPPDSDRHRPCRRGHRRAQKKGCWPPALRPWKSRTSTRTARPPRLPPDQHANRRRPGLPRLGDEGPSPLGRRRTTRRVGPRKVLARTEYPVSCFHREAAAHEAHGSATRVGAAKLLHDQNDRRDPGLPGRPPRRVRHRRRMGRPPGGAHCTGRLQVEFTKLGRCPGEPPHEVPRMPNCRADRRLQPASSRA
jgi:hypothetical protein